MRCCDEITLPTDLFYQQVGGQKQFCGVCKPLLGLPTVRRGVVIAGEFLLERRNTHVAMTRHLGDAVKLRRKFGFNTLERIDVVMDNTPIDATNG